MKNYPIWGVLASPFSRAEMGLKQKDNSNSTVSILQEFEVICESDGLSVWGSIYRGREVGKNGCGK